MTRCKDESIGGWIAGCSLDLYSVPLPHLPVLLSLPLPSQSWSTNTGTSHLGSELVNIGFFFDLVVFII